MRSRRERFPRRILEGKAGTEVVLEGQDNAVQTSAGSRCRRIRGRRCFRVQASVFNY